MKTISIPATSIVCQLNRFAAAATSLNFCFKLSGSHAPISAQILNQWLVKNRYCSVVIDHESIPRYRLTNSGLVLGLGRNAGKYREFNDKSAVAIYALLVKHNYF